MNPIQFQGKYALGSKPTSPDYYLYLNGDRTSTLEKTIKTIEAQAEAGQVPIKTLMTGSHALVFTADDIKDPALQDAFEALENSKQLSKTHQQTGYKISSLDHQEEQLGKKIKFVYKTSGWIMTYPVFFESQGLGKYLKSHFRNNFFSTKILGKPKLSQEQQTEREQLKAQLNEQKLSSNEAYKMAQEKIKALMAQISDNAWLQPGDKTNTLFEEGILSVNTGLRKTSEA